MLSMGERSVISCLYRSLLRTGRKFDSHPDAKLLIYRTSAVYDVKMNSSSQQYYDGVLSNILNGRILLNPKDNVSIQKVFKTEFRKHMDIEALSIRIDAGFSMNRKLKSIWSCFEAIEQDKALQITQSFEKVESATYDLKVDIESSGLLPTFQHWNDDIAAGMVLLAHPLVQGPLCRAMVLVVQHDAESGSSYGLVINRPLADSLKRVVHNLPDNLAKSFASSAVSFGGLVRRMQFLHNDPQCGGSAVPIPHSKEPFYAGGDIELACRQVEGDFVKQLNYSFYAGCCTWSTGQLQTEVQQGLWVPLLTQPDLAVSLANYAVHDRDRSASVVTPYSIGRIALNDEDDRRRERTEAQRSRMAADPVQQEARRKIEQLLAEQDVDDEKDRMAKQAAGTTSSESNHTESSKPERTAAADFDVASRERRDLNLRERRRREKERQAGEEAREKREADACQQREEAARRRYLDRLTPGQLERAQRLTAMREGLLARPNDMVPYRVDLYEFAVRGLGDQFRGFAELPGHLDSSSVEPCDWAHSS